MKIEKLSRKIERELEKLSNMKFKKEKTVPKYRKLSVVKKEILRAAKYFSKMCKDRELCFNILVELLERYRPDDVIAWIQEKILSSPDKPLDAELQKVAMMCSIQVEKAARKSRVTDAIGKLRSLLSR